MEDSTSPPVDCSVLFQIRGTGLTANFSRAEIEGEIRYHHPEKTLAALPTRPAVTDDLIAPLFGVDVVTYQEIKAGFEEQAKNAAQGLLQDARLKDLVGRLPFEPGATVVAVGDSITDDLLSWFEILRHLLAEARPGVRLVNAGISGDTTSGLLSRLLYVLEEEPDWLILLIGTNDVPFLREPPTKPQVGRRETAENLRALHDLARARSGARLVWITPPSALDNRTQGVPPEEPVWRTGDLAEVADLVREVAGSDTLVDLWETYEDPAGAELFMPDGLHPSLEGQQTIARAFVKRLGGV